MKITHSFVQKSNRRRSKRRNKIRIDIGAKTPWVVEQEEAAVKMNFKIEDARWHLHIVAADVSLQEGKNTGTMAFCLYKTSYNITKKKTSNLFFMNRWVFSQRPWFTHQFKITIFLLLANDFYFFTIILSVDFFVILILLFYTFLWVSRLLVSSRFCFDAINMALALTHKFAFKQQYNVWPKRKI